MNRKQRRMNKKANGKVNGVSKPVQRSPSTVTSAPPSPELIKRFRHGKSLMEKGNKGDLAEATEIFRDIMREKPDYIPAVEQMAVCAFKLGEYDTALNFFETLRKVRPDSKAKWDAYIGCVYGETDQYDKAIELLEGSYDEVPIVQIQGTLATAYFQMGQFEKGRKYVERALEQEPDNLLYLNIYASRLHKFESEDDELLQRLLKIRETQSKHLNDDDLCHLHYTLFKAYNELKDYETAFGYAIEGAAYKRKTIDYSPMQMAIFFGAIRKYFSEQFYNSYTPKTQNMSEKPVFILAMPRSGTTLLEQILTAHPKISGIGEDSHLFNIVRKFASIPDYTTDNKFPFGWINDPKRAMAPHQIGDDYLNYIDQKHPDAERVINKAIGTYMQVGYIHLAMPNAKLIHIKRNAMDSCLSTFTQLFAAKAQNYSYNMAELGDRYVQYMKLMEHWLDLFPEKILEVEYEELVKDTEGQARRILDFVGMEWHDDCLKFYEQKSIVKTASLEQVRKPIYTSSINRWMRYGAEIKPLIEALGDYAPPEAVAYLNGDDAIVSQDGG